MSLFDTPLTPYPIAPESLPPSPRPVEFTAKARWMRSGFWAGLLLAPNLILYFGYNYAADLRALADRGQVLSGQVASKRTQYHSRGGSTYHVAYSFTAGGRKWTGDGDVSFKEFQTLAEGASCSVTYLPEQPSTNCLGEATPRLNSLNRKILLYAVIVAILFGYFVVVHEYKLSREKWLARYGIAVVGWITSRDKRASWNSRYGNNRKTAYWVHYRFSLPNDKRVDSWAYLSQDAWEYLFPQTPATILYDPEDPPRSLPLCAFRYVCFLPAEEMVEACSQMGEDGVSVPEEDDAG
jgi:hypothetical protein